MTAAKNGLLKSHPIEEKMGILYYITTTEGIGGKLRKTPQDFRVEEILKDGRVVSIDDEDFSLGPDEPGLFTEFVLIKKGIESHKALMKIATALGRDISDINLAGTKDKMAITAQRATIWRCPPEELLKVKINGIKIRAPRTTIYKTYLGDLKGNYFTIRVKDLELSNEEITNRFESIFREITEKHGIPNYFGHQRFGSRRPISHHIGRLILLGDIEAAIQEFLSYISEDESEIVKNARQIYRETNDPKAMLEAMPKTMIFEKHILEHLSNHPGDYQGAFQKIPRNLQRMFIHSYQSYIWNRTLSKRLELFPDLQTCPLDTVQDGQNYLPIIGYKTVLPDNELFDFTKELLDQDGVEQQQFIVPVIPSLKFSGSRRPLAIKPKNFSYGIEADANKNKCLIIKFSLGSGSYATIVLREFMKTTPLYY